MKNTDGLIAAQLATVRMLQSEKKTVMSGGSSRINIDEWAKWHDLDVEDVVKLQDYCYDLEEHELILKTVDSVDLNVTYRKCVLKYLNLYGTVLCKIASDGDENKFKTFLMYSSEAYITRYMQSEHIELNASDIIDIIQNISMKYLAVIADEVNQLLKTGYVWDIIPEICAFFNNINQYKSFRSIACVA